MRLKYGKLLMISALFASFLMTQPAWADGPAAAPGGPGGMTAEHNAPPGDEGTTLSPVIVAGQGGKGAGSQQMPAPGGNAQMPGGNGPAPGGDAQMPGGNGPAPGGDVQAPDGQPQVLLPIASPDDPGQVMPEAAGTQPTASGRYIDPSKPMVALTFDDGPQTSVGNRIMDCLAQYGGKATFFMVGDRVPSRAAEVQRMVAEGHEVANHSMNHKYLQKLGAAEIQAQVVKCNDAIEAACGVRPKIMRLPGGNHNATVRANTHMPMIQWNIDTLDWKTKNADKTVAAVLGNVRDGDIVLMHELYSQTGDAAVRIIPELVNRGYQLVTVSEMAAAKGYTLEAGKLYSSFR